MPACCGSLVTNENQLTPRFRCTQTMGRPEWFGMAYPDQPEMGLAILSPIEMHIEMKLVSFHQYSLSTLIQGD